MPFGNRTWRAGKPPNDSDDFTARIRVPTDQQGHIYFSHFISMVKVAMMEASLGLGLFMVVYCHQLVVVEVKIKRE